MVVKMKVLTTEELMKINEASVMAGRNQNLTLECMRRLDPMGIHVITWHMVYNEVEIRGYLAMKHVNQAPPAWGLLDMSFDEFGSLREIEVRD